MNADGTCQRCLDLERLVEALTDTERRLKLRQTLEEVTRVHEALARAHDALRLEHAHLFGPEAAAVRTTLLTDRDEAHAALLAYRADHRQCVGDNLCARCITYAPVIRRALGAVSKPAGGPAAG